MQLKSYIQRSHNKLNFFSTFLLQSLEAKPKSPQREGDDLVLVCSAQGSSRTTFSWYKNGFLLNVTRSIRLVYLFLKYFLQHTLIPSEKFFCVLRFFISFHPHLSFISTYSNKIGTDTDQREEMEKRVISFMMKGRLILLV